MPAPSPQDEYQRIQILARYQVLDTLPAEVFDRVERLADRVPDVPVDIVNFVDRHRQWGNACSGMQGGEAPRRLLLRLLINACLYRTRELSRGGQEQLKVCPLGPVRPSSNCEDLLHDPDKPLA